MKRVFFLFIFAFLLVPSNSFAAGYNGDVFIYPTLKVNINGIQDTSGESGKFFNGDKLVPKVMFFKGTTYVPIRYFSNLLGINDIGWDGESKTIWVDSEKPKDIDLKEAESVIKIDSYMTADRKSFTAIKLFFYPDIKLYFNGIEDKTGNEGLFNNGIDNVPKTLNYEGTTYVPLRYFAVHLGIKNEDIKWDNSVPQISINNWTMSGDE